MGRQAERGREKGGKGSAAKGNGSRCNAHYQQSTVGQQQQQQQQTRLLLPAKRPFLTSFEPFVGLGKGTAGRGQPGRQAGRRRNAHFAAFAALV